MDFDELYDIVADNSTELLEAGLGFKRVWRYVEDWLEDEDLSVDEDDVLNSVGLAYGAFEQAKDGLDDVLNEIEEKL